MSLSKSFETVLVTSTTDPAIDEAAMLATIDYGGTQRARIEAFVLTRDLAHVVFLPGSTPVKYTLRPLSARESNSLVADLRAPSPDELWTLVQRCLVSVNPSEIAIEHRTLDAVRGTRMVTDDSMEALAAEIGLAGLRELGSAVLQRVVPSARALAPFASPRG